MEASSSRRPTRSTSRRSARTSSTNQVSAFCTQWGKLICVRGVEDLTPYDVSRSRRWSRPRRRSRMMTEDRRRDLQPAGAGHSPRVDATLRYGLGISRPIDLAEAAGERQPLELEEVEGPAADPDLELGRAVTAGGGPSGERGWLYYARVPGTKDAEVLQSYAATGSSARRTATARIPERCHREVGEKRRHMRHHPALAEKRSRRAEADRSVDGREG